MYDREFTPERITALKPNEIFVFGSNLAGSHGGANRLPIEKWLQSASAGTVFGLPIL